MDKQAGDFTDLVKGIFVSSLTIFSLAHVPVFSSITVIFTPLPVMYYFSKLGRTAGALVIGLSFVLVYLGMELLESAVLFPVSVLLGILGLVIFEVWKLNLKMEKTVIVATVIFMAVGLLALVYEGHGENLSLWQLLQSYMTVYIQANIEAYSKLNLAPEHLALLRENIREIVRIFMMIFPAIALISVAFTVIVNHLGASFIFPWAKLYMTDLGDLKTWRPPEKIIWILIVSGGMLLLPVVGSKVIGLNLLIILAFIYLLAGLAITDYFLVKINIPAYFRYIFYFILFAQQYLLLFVITLGLIDVWADFRKQAINDVK